MKKINLKIVGVCVAIFIAAVLIFNGLNFRGGINKTDVKAAATDNVAGYAWSENIGWISFNSTNCDTDANGFIDVACGGNNTTTTVTNYGVNLNLGTGNLSGYAWSENIGWVSFNAADVAVCPAGTCQPRLVGSDFLGWARALANGGGWDGWISLNCANGGVCVPSNYKVSLSGNNFIGYGWGGDVVGWINFNGTPGANYKVYIPNASPTVTPQAVNIPGDFYCTNPPIAISLSWIFNDTEDGTTQTAYQIKITRDGSWVYDSGKKTSSSTSVTGAFVNSEPGYSGFFDYGSHSYSWTIQVWDSGNLSDPLGPKAGANFNTPAHMYPTADFICSPSSTSCPLSHGQFEPISFINKSVCYDNSNNPVACSSRSWNFGDGSPVSTEQNPEHTYTTQNITPYNLKLTITDVNGNECSKEQGISIGASKPKWKEVLPK